MKADTVTVRSLFKIARRYVVPIYQRHYVWTLEGQWKGLWDDLLMKANARLGGAEQIQPHYLGAVVLNGRGPTSATEVPVCEVIDGQQRMTTLQVVLAAIRDVASLRGLDKLSRQADRNTTNPDAEDMREPEVDVHRLWPTHHDRDTYLKIMTARSRAEVRARFLDHFPRGGTSLKKVNLRDQPNLLKAYIFFHDEVARFAVEGDAAEARINALLLALLDDFRVVEIQLQADDDPQVIFETLNDRGKPLLAFDLIRNFIFMRAARSLKGTAAERLYDQRWKPLEASFWTEDENRGRLKRPRIEFFMLQYLTARTGGEVTLAGLFGEYKDFLGVRGAPADVGAEVDDIIRYSELYQRLATGSGEDALGRVGRRLKPWDVSTAWAPVLAIAASQMSEDEREQAFSDIVSYVVRRAVVGGTAANYNRVFLGLARAMVDKGPSADLVRSYLLGLKGNSTEWPTDADFSHHWLNADLYGRMKPPGRLVAILAEIEMAAQGAKADPAPLPRDLWVEHLMPQTWDTHWPLPDGKHATWQEVGEVEALGAGAIETLTAAAQAAEASGDPAAVARVARQATIARRMRAVQTVGNLTLHTRFLGWDLGNKGFVEKQKLFREHGRFWITQPFSGADVTAWDEAAILRRGELLLKRALDIWSRPQATPAAAGAEAVAEAAE
ncbi:DUF262 domain-containing protein [Paracraurococcus lichenis]|uniref:DUF262 domain-containing protein n=1 Tax=Paracraurococcus lichenis TaxID=3064888 RepID=A0ABT9EB19_9PROT|nr:DUF262 domain-containing protein [Paracraurococcus sp. LOR1-02]MDO9713168.1 DUF262 domain-containing protein [Paracraurococcus sp. LOR1-02]